MAYRIEKSCALRKSWRQSRQIIIGGTTMDTNPLVDLSKAFAVDILLLCSEIKENRQSNSLINQLLRSGTSIGANIHEANYAASRSDFINKLQIAMKECYETEYWLDIFHEAKILTEEEHRHLFAQCSKIRKILTASITTAKQNAAREDDKSSRE